MTDTEVPSRISFSGVRPLSPPSSHQIGIEQPDINLVSDEQNENDRNGDDGCCCTESSAMSLTLL